jgi:UDP-2-acetamido-2,6-beta-L-arabino-hexul-4-ose reductase
MTGSQGFIGNHIMAKLKEDGITEISEFNKDDDISALSQKIPDCDVIIHLAGVMRPEDKALFRIVNEELTKTIVDLTSKHGKKLIFSSSIMAELDTDYGRSKKAGEQMLLSLGDQGVTFRLNNVFGANASPDTVIPIFCHNISRHQPITILENRNIQFIHISDVANTFVDAVRNFDKYSGKINYIEPSYSTTILKLAEAIFDIKNDVQKPNNRFYALLKETYASYAP